MQLTITEKQKSREANEAAAAKRASEELERKKTEEEIRLREEKERQEQEEEEQVLQEQIVVEPKVPNFIKPFQETSWFQKYYEGVPIEVSY